MVSSEGLSLFFGGDGRPAHARGQPRGPCGVVAAAARPSIENGDGAGPPGRGGMDLHGKATDRKSLVRKLVEIVQLLDMAIADLAAGAVALPNDFRIVSFGIFRLGVYERRVPAPAVGAGDAHAALQEIERRL